MQMQYTLQLSISLPIDFNQLAVTRTTKKLLVFLKSDMSSNHISVSQPFRASPAQPASEHPKATQSQLTTQPHSHNPEFLTVSIFRDLTSAL